MHNFFTFSSILADFASELLSNSSLKEASLSAQQIQTVRRHLHTRLGAEQSLWQLLEFSSKVCDLNTSLRKANSVLTAVVLNQEATAPKTRNFSEVLRKVTSHRSSVETDSIGNELMHIGIRVAKNLFWNKMEVHPELERVLGIRHREMRLIFESSSEPLHMKSEIIKMNVSKEIMRKELIKRGQNVFEKIIKLATERVAPQNPAIEAQKTGPIELASTPLPASRSSHSPRDLDFSMQAYTKAIDFMLQTENLCIVSGPEASGKSFLVDNYLARHPEHLKIVIDKSIEAKSLIGDYVVSHSNPLTEDVPDNSSAKTGFFEWKDGPLVECMRRGRLLVLEQVETGNDEIQGFLKGFVRSKQVQVRGEVLTVGNGFGLLVVWRTTGQSFR